MKRGLCVAVLTLASTTWLCGEVLAMTPAEARAVGLAQQDRFTNEDVVTMVQAGFAKETIIAAVKSHGPDFDTSLDGLMALRDAGVDEDIIREILAAATAAADRAPDVDQVPDADDANEEFPSGDGVYALVDGEHVLLAVEPIEWRSAFWAGRTRVGALTTARLNARLPGLHSPFVVPRRPELILVCAECETGLEYHLVRAHDDVDKREFHVSFQVLSGRNETWIAQGGQKGARVPFRAERLGDGKFRLSLPDLEPNDYGFLPPSRGANPQSLATSVMYTFLLQPGARYATRPTADAAAAPRGDVTDDAMSAPIHLTAALEGPDNDVEEEDNGELYFDDRDIDLGEVVVGLRFPHVAIPAGATIVSAHLQFTAEENDGEATTVHIRAEAVGDAAPFRDEDNNLTSRTFTPSVGWAPSPWRKGDANVAQRTSDLAPLLQAVVSRPDWREGNAVVFMLQGRGQRDAESYDTDDPGRGARLVVSYRPAPPPLEP